MGVIRIDLSTVQISSTRLKMITVEINSQLFLYAPNDHC